MTTDHRPAGATSLSRRLAAILAIDVVGYSRMMEADEEGTHSRVRALLERTVRGRAADHAGRILHTTGDGALIEFPSVVEATRCGLSILDDLPQHNADADDDNRLEVRIGINLGDVIAEPDDIFGNGVNVAVRLEGLADPDSICLSEGARGQLGEWPGFQCEDLGYHQLKNIRRPIRAYIIRRARSGGARTKRASATAASERAGRASIAVLPFREAGPEPHHGYFGDGVVEDVVGALASLPDLLVVSRGSTLRYKRADEDLSQVAREIGVRYVVTGAVRRAAGRLRIAAKLNDAESGEVVWADRIEGDEASLLDLQDRLTERIVTTLAPNLRGAEIQRAMRTRPENLSAYDFFLRGLDRLYRLQREEFDSARDMFVRAMDLDHRYAAPYAFMALWYSIRLGQGWSEDVAADSARMAEMAAAAIDRDPFDASALALSGHIRAFRFRDFDGALALFDRAIAVCPNSSVAWIRSSPAYSYLGDTAEARRRAEQGIRLSPVDLHLFYSHATMALAAYTAGSYDEAVSWARRAWSQNPRFAANLRILAASLAAADRGAEAATVGGDLLRLMPAFRVTAFCDGYAYSDHARRAQLATHLKAAGLPE